MEWSESRQGHGLWAMDLLAGEKGTCGDRQEEDTGKKFQAMN